MGADRTHASTMAKRCYIIIHDHNGQAPALRLFRGRAPADDRRRCSPATRRYGWRSTYQAAGDRSLSGSARRGLKGPSGPPESPNCLPYPLRNKFLPLVCPSNFWGRSKFEKCLMPQSAEEWASGWHAEQDTDGTPMELDGTK